MKHFIEKVIDEFKKRKHRIIYFPLETYKERYTYQLSRKDTGWIERRWKKYNIPYLRIEGKRLTTTIKNGLVLDACGRGYWATSQIQQFLKLVNERQITEKDILYIDDFWHPGIEAIMYAFHLLKIKIPLFTMCWAQTVDLFDFTYPMRNWMRPFEMGISKIMTGIFANSSGLKDLMIANGIGTEASVHVVGQQYCSEEVISRFKRPYPLKKLQVIYSGRWDWEKDPLFFLNVIDNVMKHRTDIKFIISSGFSILKSNKPQLIDELHKCVKKYPKNIEIRTNQTKKDYYNNLLESAMHFSCSLQDWVSYVLLEATTAGCFPVYPYWRSFPEVFGNARKYLYTKDDVSEASQIIINNIDHAKEIKPTNYTEQYKDIYQKFDNTWARQLSVMLGCSFPSPYGEIK